MREFIIANLNEALKVLEEYKSLQENCDSIESAAVILIETIRNGNKIISCGNGGSMTDAMHFAEELSGLFRDNRPALPAISISDPAHITCVANDIGFEAIFSRFIESVGQQGDCLLAISTSGNSMNIVRAVEAAHDKGMKTIGLTGKSGGLLSGMVDREIRVKGRKFSDRIQEIHMLVLHILVGLIEKELLDQK
jgi:D-sedoheptulose 7-phosphate isomerase